MYTINPYDKRPIMVLDAQIGQDPDDPTARYIDGSAFANELMSLDQQDKDGIEIWINCVGGKVMDAMNIYNAILASKTKVDTVNIGVCASSASFIYMAGRNRTAWPYAKWMFHSPFVPGQEGESESTRQLRDSIVTMIADRCTMSNDEVSNMLSGETWMDCSRAVEMKICLDVKDMEKANRKPLTGDARAMWNEAQLVLNSVKSSLNSNTKMKTIAKSLGLADDATEEQIAEAINALKTAKPDDSAELKATQEKLDAVQNKLKDIETAQNLSVENAAKEKATALIAKHENRLGTMTDDVRNAWIADATKDYTATENKILALPLRSASIEAVANKLPEGTLPTTTFGQMAKIKNQLKSEGRQVYNP